MFSRFYIILSRYRKNTSVTNYRVHLLNGHDLIPNSKTFTKNQRKLTDMFANNAVNPTKKNKIDEHQQLQFLLNRQFVLWICKALLPFETVENVGFDNLWAWLQQYSKLPTGLQLPSRGTMAVGALNDVYLCYKTKLIEVLKDSGEHATVTLDAWTDKYKRTAYITFTYHYMKNWKINTAVLRTTSFPHPHTGVRVREAIESTLFDFHLSSKKITFASDNGTEMVAACNLMKRYRQPCIGHAIHRLISFDLLGIGKKNATPNKFQEIVDLAVKLRKINFKLVYRQEEMKSMWAQDQQEKLMSVIRDFTENGTIFSSHNVTDIEGSSLMVPFYFFSP